jgi:hypothetical protein
LNIKNSIKRRNVHFISLSIFSIIALITNSHLSDTDKRDIVSVPHPVIIASKNKNWTEKYGNLSWYNKIKLANEHYYTGHILYDRSIRNKDEFKWID